MQREILNARDAERKRPKKWARVLQALIDGRSLNRFEAETDLHDHCLPSTIAAIQARGVAICRREEVVPGFQGLPTRCVRYWLPEESRAAARRLLAGEDDDRPVEVHHAATADEYRHASGR